MDIIIGGNKFAMRPQFGRYDASFGNVFLSDKKGKDAIIYRDLSNSGFYVQGEIKAIKPIKDKKDNKYLFVGINNSNPKLFKLND